MPEPLHPHPPVPRLRLPPPHGSQSGDAPLQTCAPRPPIRLKTSQECIPVWEAISQFSIPCGRADLGDRTFWRKQPGVFHTLLEHYCPGMGGTVRFVPDRLSLYIHLEMPFARFTIRISTHAMSQNFRTRFDRVPVSGMDLASRTGSITFGELMEEAVQFFESVRPDSSPSNQQN